MARNQTIGGLSVSLDLNSAKFTEGIEKSKRAVGGFNDSAKQMKSSLQNVGYQIQDFAVQVSSGTSATQALAQQLPQLLSGFGLFGVLAGTAAAVLIPLGRALLDSSSDTKEFTNSIKENNDSVLDLIDKYGALADSIIVVQANARAAARDIALENLAKILNGTAIGEASSRIKVAGDDLLRNGSLPVKGLAKDYGITNEQVLKLIKSQEALDKAITQGDYYTASNSVKEISNQIGNATKEARLAQIEYSKLLKILQQLGPDTSARAANKARKEFAEIDPRSLGTGETAKEFTNRLKLEAEVAKKLKMNSIDEALQYEIDATRDNFDKVSEIRRKADAEVAKRRVEIFANTDYTNAQKEALFRSEAAVIRAKELTDVKAEERSLERQILDAQIAQQNATIRLNEQAFTRKKLNADIYEGLRKQTTEYEAQLKKAQETDQFARTSGGQFIFEELAKLERATEEARTKVLKNIGEFGEGGDDISMELARQNEEYEKRKGLIVQIGQAMDEQKQAFERTQSVFSNLNSAFDDFVDNGKFRFKELADSIIRDLLKIELKAQALSLYRSAGGISGIGSALSGLFGGFRAEGGPVSSGKTYLVGERGPELFTPGANGSIIPNNQIGGGQETVVNNYYISAIDTQSFAVALSKNKEAVFGAVQSFQKSNPQGGRY